MDLIIAAIAAMVIIDHYERHRDPNKRDLIDRLAQRWR